MTTESAGSVELTIRVFSHPGGAPRPFSLLVNTEDGTASMSTTIRSFIFIYTAVVDDDYVPVSGQLNAGDVTQMYTILMNDDDSCEKVPNENFFSNTILNRGIPDILLTIPRATIIIDDTAEPECGKPKVVYIGVEQGLYF